MEAFFYFSGRLIGKDKMNETDIIRITDTIIREGFRGGLDLKQQRKRAKRCLMNACDDWHPHRKLSDFHKKLLVGCVLVLVKVGEIDNNGDDGYILLKKKSRRV